jgi:hypothetical protein
MLGSIPADVDNSIFTWAFICAAIQLESKTFYPLDDLPPQPRSLLANSAGKHQRVYLAT